MPIVPFEEFGAGSEVEPEAPPGEQAQPNLVSFEDFGKGEGGPTESNDFMGRALSSMKSAGGNTAVLADLILGAPWFAISFGANLGAQAASLAGGEEQPRPADDPLSFRQPSALKVAGQSGRRMQGQLMEDFGNPLHQVLKLLGTKQIYEESALAGGLEKVSSWIERAGDWVEHKTGGKVPSEEVTTMVDGLMLLGGSKGGDLVKRLWEKRKAEPAPYTPKEVPLEQTVKQGPRATAQQDINEMLNIRSTRDRKAYEQKRRREVREAFTNDPDYADYLKFRADERVSNHDNWTKAAQEREAREQAARASEDPKVPKPPEPAAEQVAEILAKPGFQRTAEDLIALRRFNQSGYVKPELLARMAAVGLGAVGGLWLDSEDPLQGSLLGGTAALAVSSLMGGPGKVTSRFKQAGAVKGPGGMWHPEAVERLSDAIFPHMLRRQTLAEADRAAGGRAGPDVVHPDVRRVAEEGNAQINWAQKAVRNYLNKYAGTERDPLRNIDVPFQDTTAKWGDVTDYSFTGKEVVPEGTRPLFRDINFEQSEAPGAKVGEKVWTNAPESSSDVRAIQSYLSHVGDYLRQNVPPEKLQQYDLVRAVRETAANDARVAKEMAKAAAASTKDLPVYKEYPDGMKWVELKMPEKLTAEQAKSVRELKGNELRDYVEHERGMDTPRVGERGYEALGPDGKPIKNNYTGARAVGKSPEEAFLAGKLAEEGNQMGHCVGGYCAGVASGESRIFSLRDKEGRSHVTIETTPTRKLIDPKFQEKGVDYPENIDQIKGKQNRAPVAEYLPYVQDFVKSGPLDTTPNLAGTKVVDSSGKPAVVYHGGEVPAKFKPMTWFAVDKKMANMYIKERGGHGAITEAYLDIKNPADEAAIETAARKVGAIGPKEHVGNAYDYVTREMYLGKSKEQGYVGKVVRELRDRGYDGVHIVTDGDFGRGEAESWMAFFDKQIHRVGKGKGQWGEVGDLRHTGLMKGRDVTSWKSKQGLKFPGERLGLEPNKYYSPEDIGKIAREKGLDETLAEMDKERLDAELAKYPTRPAGARGRQEGSIDLKTAAKLVGVVGGAAVGAAYADNKVMGAILGGLGGLVLGGASPKGVASVFKKAWAPDTRIRINNLANSWEYKTEAAARGVFQLQTRLEQLLPKEADRVAVTHAIESGDLSTLSPRQRSAAGIAQQYFAKMAEVGQEAGVLKDAVANYVTHLWKQGTAAAGIVDEIFGRKGGFNMSPETKFALRRSVPTIAEGKAKGMIPKTEDISAIMGVYGNAINRAMANKELITALKNEKVPGTEDGLVLKDRDAPATYQKIDHPQLAGMRVHPDIVPSMKFIFDNHQPGVVMRGLEGLNMLSKRMAVSFSLFHAKALADAFIGAASNPLKVGKHIAQSVAPKIFGENEYLKQLRTGGAGDLVDTAQQAGLKFSMGKETVGVEDVNGTFYTAMKDLQSGLDGVVKGLGLPVKGFIQANHAMDKFMWGRLHAGMKLSTFAEKYATLLENNAKAHEKNPQVPMRPKEQLAEMAASFTNDVFGGLNWRRIAEGASTKWGRDAALNLLSPAGRRVSQLLLFAPDWTLSTFRAAANAFSPTGSGIRGLIEPKTAADLHRQYLVRSAIYYVTVGEAINLAMSGHHLWENKDPTTIDMGDGRTMQWSKHTMESVHWLTKPRQQGLNKLGFIPKEIATQAFGVEYLSAYGKSPPMGNRVAHVAKSFLPISAQSFAGSSNSGITEFLASAAGTPIYGKTYAEREALKEQRRIKQRAERKIK